MCSHGVCSLPGKHSRDTFDDAADPSALLQGQFGLADPFRQAVEDHEGTVVGFGRGHLVKLTVHGERQEPAFLAGDRAPVVQVSLVPHNDNGHFLLAGAFLGCLDGLDFGLDAVEAGPVADAVDEEDAVSPLDPLVLRRTLVCSLLRRREWNGTDQAGGSFSSDCRKKSPCEPV